MNKRVLVTTQFLSSFTGSPITRFDSGLESFESIVDASGLSEEKTIKILRVKSTDRAFSVIQALLKDHPHDYDSGLDSILQAKDKYPEFREFNELVALTRVDASRLETLETDQEKQEFIRSIDGSHDTKNAELKSSNRC
ncbi:hypothetical protein OUZ56_024234 [Daphnia magna]|uniref:Uncharacterized protein n=1 Tax=Daphnia magna TaxID=35525 RepID=A0ABR0B0D6_9CRUS|nr:hypothetical protein OUZ56_024234 [Daphnia magna]